MQRYDCTNGGAQFCQGCYTMTPDTDGDYVTYADHAAALAAKDAEIASLERECAVRNERELGYLSRAQSAEARAERAEREAARMLAAVVLAAGGRVVVRPAHIVRDDLVLERTEDIQNDSIVFAARAGGEQHKPTCARFNYVADHRCDCGAGGEHG